MSYHAGPHGEASGSVRRQRACGKTMGKNLDWFLEKGTGKAEV